MYDVKTLQTALKSRGFNPGTIDGVMGRNTRRAISEFKKSVGLNPRATVGPITWAKLTGDPTEIKQRISGKTLIPWYEDAMSIIGLHEDRDNSELAAWLRSDGATVGDPSEIPWCGDAVETAIKRTLVDEDVPTNPYLAANWAKWGTAVPPQLGCVLSFWRGSPTSWKGHVGFYAGESASNFYVLGGNQRDQMSIAPLSKRRLRTNGSRWPLTGMQPTGQRVQMTGGTVSHNEA